MMNMHPLPAPALQGFVTDGKGARDIEDILRLAPGRAHEFCGAARRMLAIWALASMGASMGAQGVHLWIRPHWEADRLNPQGLRGWLDPGALILLDTAQDTEALACAEEALRSGAVASVTLELRAPPALTPLRRLHLAAERGLARRRTHRRDAGLLALVLTPGEGGTPGIESRWQLAPCPPPMALADRTVPLRPFWQLQRLRARMAPPATWHVTQTEDGALQIATVPTDGSA